MKKFLELVEENNPEKDIDAITDAKRSLQRLLMKSKIEAHGKAFEDILRVRLDDGRVVELEVKDVQHPVEDQEDDVNADAAIQAAAAADPDSPAGKAVEDRNKKVTSRLKEYEQATRVI
tara:strand:- start:87 stop:443 length:357 start_codon:yes stop_codon:yes gene_type:complete